MSFQVPQKMSTAGKLGDENINVFEVCEAACEIKYNVFSFVLVCDKNHFGAPFIESKLLYFKRSVPSQQKGFLKVFVIVSF